MKKLNQSFQLPLILTLFWSAFWILNGGDKFLNGSMEPMIEPGLERAVMVDGEGNITSTMYGYETNGLFGSNRNAKTITFFERMGLSSAISLPLLYLVAIFEIIIGGIFLTAAIQLKRMPKNFTDCVDFGYKLSLILFTLFCSVDILIGERIELWEHTTFMVALLAFRWVTHQSNDTNTLDLNKPTLKNSIIKTSPAKL